MDTHRSPDALCLLVLCLGVLVGPLPAAPEPRAACTHYASPSGGGTGLAQSSPFQIRQFWAVATPGTVLCLLDGTYTGGNSMLQVPTTFAGTASQPITIRALNEGQVLINGQDSARPVDLRGAWGILEGINATLGDNANIAMRGSDWIVRRVGSWDGGVGEPHLIVVSGNRNTLEDCFAFGRAEKLLAAGAGATGARHNTIRRCWIMATDAGDAPGGTNGMEQGYGQDAVTMENVLVTWNISGASGAPTGALRSFRTQGSRLLGSLVYLFAESNTPRLNEMVSAYTDGGSPSQFPECQSHPAMNNTYRDLVSFVQPGHPNFGSLRPFTFLRSNTDAGCPTAPAGSGNTVTNILGVGGQSPLISPDSYSVTQSRHGATLGAALAGSGHSSLWTLMPGLCTRYVNGALTTQGLWPWPMNQRISEALRQAGRPPVDITATLETLFGAIPSQCRSAGEPAPPGTPPVVEHPTPRHLRLLDAP